MDHVWWLRSGASWGCSLTTLSSFGNMHPSACRAQDKKIYWNWSGISECFWMKSQARNRSTHWFQKSNAETIHLIARRLSRWFGFQATEFIWCVPDFLGRDCCGRLTTSVSIPFQLPFHESLVGFREVDSRISYPYCTYIFNPSKNLPVQWVYCELQLQMHVHFQPNQSISIIFYQQAKLARCIYIYIYIYTLNDKFLCDVPSAWKVQDRVPGIEPLLTKENPEREREREVSLFLQNDAVLLSRNIDAKIMEFPVTDSFIV